MTLSMLFLRQKTNNKTNNVYHVATSTYDLDFLLFLFLKANKKANKGFKRKNHTQANKANKQTKTKPKIIHDT